MANVTGNEVTELLENFITLTNFNTNKLYGRIIADVLQYYRESCGRQYAHARAILDKKKKRGKKRKKDRVYSVRIHGDKWNSFH